MGDRANVIIRGHKEQVCVYTHWSGSERKEITAAALARSKDRWNDPSYLARVILDQFTDGDRGTTGFGVWSTPQDNEYPFLIVDCDKQACYDEKDDREGFGYLPAPKSKDTKPMAFEDFIKANAPAKEAA